MTDIFEEVEEQLRSDRYQQLIFRSWPWIAGVAAAVLLGALGWWAYDTWSTREAAKASEVYSAALDSLGQGDTKAAFAKFSEAEKSPSRGYKALSLMQQGAIRLQEGKREDAVKLFDQAASASPNPIMGDMARLKSAFALMDTAPYAVMQERLTPLIDLKRPYHVAAPLSMASRPSWACWCTASGASGSRLSTTKSARASLSRPSFSLAIASASRAATW